MKEGIKEGVKEGVKEEEGEEEEEKERVKEGRGRWKEKGKRKGGMEIKGRCWEVASHVEQYAGVCSLACWLDYRHGNSN